MSRYQLLPPLSDEEYAALREDIRGAGVRVPIDVDEDGNILDGHHRKAIADELGKECPERVVRGLPEFAKVDYALTVNLTRRHLDKEGRKALVTRSLKRDPRLSDREHARRCGVSHTYVSGVREALEAAEQLATSASRVGKDGRERSLPTDHRGSSIPGEADGSAPSAGAGSRVGEPAPTSDPVGVQPSAEAAGVVGHPAPAAQDHPDVNASAVPGEQGGPAPSPAGPSCEKCGTDIDDDGYRRCSGCDVDGLHTADDDGNCRLCALLATVPDEYLTIQIADGVHGLQLECGCGAVVSHLKAGMPLGIALVEAYLHHGTCQ